MEEKRLTKISKFLAYHLRHAPEKLGLHLQPGGWVSVVELLKAAQSTHFPITLTELEVVVQTNDKKRFSFDENKTRIRANQGHSIAVDLRFTPVVPPPILYHGTHQKILQKILAEGLRKMSRHHVHLSDNKETALKVGSRRSQPVIFQVNSQKMNEDGILFYRSDNNIWLVDYVDSKYLTLLT